MNNNYRKGVGAVIINNSNLIFIAERIKPNNAWQMPQGGIDANETPQEALMRELKEEIGTNNIAILGQTPWLQYDFSPNIIKEKWYKGYHGQQQIWFFVKFNGSDTDINLNFTSPAEFKAWKWVEYRVVPEIIVDFKKAMYKQIIDFGLKNNILKQ